MKIVFLILNMLFCFSVSLLAQGFEWEIISKPSFANYRNLCEDSYGNLYFSNGSVFQSKDHGLTWQDCTPKLEYAYIHTLSTDNNGRIYVSGTSGVGKYYIHAIALFSDDTASSWKDLHAGTITHFAFDSSGSIYATTGTCCNFVDHGSFVKLPKDSTKWTLLKDFAYISFSFYIFVDNKHNLIANGSYAVVGGARESPNNIWRSTDDGKSWVGSELVDVVSDIRQSANGYIFLANGYTEPGKIIFCSKDNGVSWSNISNGSNAPADIQTMVIDKNDNIIVGTTNQGVLYSNDYGSSWHTINSGLGTGLVKKLLISKNGYIYAGINNGELYRSSSPINITHTDPDPVANLTFSLSQNYPNPFNPSTSISYSIPESRNVKLAVYDMLGKEVSILVNEYKSAGSYTVQFNGSSLPSGLYLYKLNAGSYSQTKKLLLLK